MNDVVRVQQGIDQALSGLRLLEHPFYKRWQAGELTMTELKEYGEQYRHFEATLPEVLRGIMSQLPVGDAAEFINDNLADEVGDPTHLELFDEFLASLGASPSADAHPATAALVDAYAKVVKKGGASGIAGLVAYETQAPGIAESKGGGLREHYGLDANATKFWDVHSTLDVEHGTWAMEALAAVIEQGEFDNVMSDANTIAKAWWEFLDERESRAELLAS